MEQDYGAPLAGTGCDLDARDMLRSALSRAEEQLAALEAAGKRLSDAFTGGGIAATEGAPHHAVATRVNNRAADILSALDRFNLVLRDIDRSRKRNPYSPPPLTNNPAHAAG